MKPFIYLLLLAFIAILFKAFFLDDYLKEQDTNSTEVVVTPSEPEPVVEEKKDVQVVEKKDEKVVENKSVHGKDESNSQKTMPLDKLGDDIANKINL
jgi:hypothetical protein